MDQKVAGTIVMNSSLESKKFLVKKDKDQYCFLTTEVTKGQTGLACILEFFKYELQIDVDKIGLIELSNATINMQNLPIFVFEVEEADIDHPVPTDYSWESPAKLREVLENYEITGVPIFQ